MTELGLVVGIDVVGLMLALLLWRQVTVRDAGSSALRRLGEAIERAARAFLWRELRLVAGAALVLAALAAAAGGALGEAQGALTRLEGVFWTLAGVCLGALGATISGYAATVLAIRGSVRAAAAGSIDAALSVAMRAAGAAALLAETLSVLGVGCSFGLIYAIKGGFAVASAETLPLASHVVLLLPSFALGATAASLVLQRGGGIFHAAGGIGSAQAGEREAGLEHDDARNPAVVTELVGDHLGASATRIVDGFAASSIANCAALIIGATLASSTRAADPLVLLALPLVLRAFGVIACAFGVLLVRSDEASYLSHALVRGYLSTAVIALVGLAGSTFWLLGARFAPVCGAGALGLVSALLAAHAFELRLSRRSTAMRDANDGLRVGSGALLGAGLAVGFESALMPICILGVATVGSVRLGALGGAPGEAALCQLVFTLAALSVAPYVLAVASLGSIADGARGVAFVSNADGDLRRRSARLDDAGFAGAAVARKYAIFSGTLSSLLIAWAIKGQARESASLPSGVESSALLWCAALGAAVVLAYGGSVARAAVRAAREVSAEVERQLRGFPREHGIAQIPADYRPSYKTCVELTTLVSQRRALPAMALGLSAPFALGLALRLIYRERAPELITQGLTWFVIAGALTGLTVALCLDATRVTLGGVLRANRARDGASAHTNSVSADAFSDVFGNAAAPALQMLAKATAAAALIATPFLL